MSVSFQIANLGKCTISLKWKNKLVNLFLTSCVVTESGINKLPAHQQIRYLLKLQRCLKKDLGLLLNITKKHAKKHNLSNSQTTFLKSLYFPHKYSLHQSIFPVFNI